MSIEWEIRVLERFTLASILGETSRILGVLLNLAPVELIACEDVRAFVASGVSKEISVTDATGELDDGVAFVITLRQDPEASTAVFVTFLRVVAQVPDDESGLWCTVSASLLRNATSYALGIATIIAAARLSKSEVVDEAKLLGPSRIHTVDDLIRSLALEEPSLTMEEAATALLRKTALQDEGH